MEEVIITIDPEANVTVSAKCIKGKACQDATRAIEEALGKKTADQSTSEMYERAQHGTINQNRA